MREVGLYVAASTLFRIHCLCWLACSLSCMELADNDMLICISLVQR